jgi:hypothetical protein
MIDKGILYRQNFGGGADMGGVKGDTRAANTGLSGGYQGGEKGGYGRRDSVQDRDRDVGVTTSAVGTLSDPKEKQDYFGSTVFGPSRKYTGSFLDNILSGGYRAVQPYAPDQFQSRLSQAGGLGKNILGGIIGLLNPAAGMLFRAAGAVPGGFERFKSSPTLADYFGGFNFGAKNISDVYANKGKGSGLRNTGIMSMPMQNIDPYKYSIGPRPVRMPQYFDNINTYEEPDFYSDAMADAYTTPTMGQYGLNLMQLNTLKNAGYSNSQIEEAVEKGYADELVRDIKGPIGIV